VLFSAIMQHACMHRFADNQFFISNTMTRVMAESCFAFVKDAAVDQSRENARKCGKKINDVLTFSKQWEKARNKEFQDFSPEKKEFRSLHMRCSCAESRT